MRNFRTFRWLTAVGISFGLSLGISRLVTAATPDTAPSELTTTLEQIETAANAHQLDAVMAFYDANFQNSDGLNRNAIQKALKDLWERYPQIKYDTELTSWEQQGNQLIAETVTHVQGTYNDQGRIMELESQLRSRQYFQQQKLVKQEILGEQTQLTSGSNPPEVKVLLPEKVKVGSEYGFDVIVQEPLNNELLLGAALEEEVSANRYLEPGTLELEDLPAGGIFKLVQAPQLPDQYWLSAILIRGDGMVMITRRVIIEE